MATPEGTRNVSTEYDPDEISKVCVPNRHAGSNGVWIGDNPFEFVLPVTLIQLFLAFAVSRALYRILRPLRTPTLVCNTVVWFSRVFLFCFILFNKIDQS
ncbi:hypothetical protein L6164_030128 [Bauhinia variegata]|uniref:Uncharacterized protein n=1 Tax=Bauhinia variegata TaxID=167791 RepID=A0ACB9LBF3_BAUVA|nr:hypothetical protein L6164_030128 [Bauhinia variegata]